MKISIYFFIFIMNYIKRDSNIRSNYDSIVNDAESNEYIYNQPRFLCLKSNCPEESGICVRNQCYCRKGFVTF